MAGIDNRDDYDKELDPMFVKNMGILGAHMVQAAQEGAQKELAESKKRRSSQSLVAFDEFERSSNRNRETTGGSLIDDNAIELLRTTTYDVKVTNAFRDFVDPMYEVMQEMHDDARTLSLIIATDQLRILRKINLSLLDQGDATDDWVGRSTTFFRRLYDHPGLSALTLFGQGFGKLVLGTVSVAKSILFGAKNDKSNTDRIVDAVEKVREFMMTNEVSQSKSLFERIKGSGIIGSAAYAVKRVGSTALGAGLSTAQERENQRSRGEDLSGGLRGILADRLFGGEITKKNKNPLDIMKTNSLDLQDDVMNRQLDEIDEWKKFRTTIIDLMSQKNDPFFDLKDITDIYERQFREASSANVSGNGTTDIERESAVGGGALVGLNHVAMSEISKLLNSSKVQNKTVSELLEYSTKQYEDSHTGLMLLEENHKTTTAIAGFSKQSMKSFEDLLNVQEDIFDETKYGADFQKKTFKETARTRRFMQLRALLGLVGSGIKSIIGAIGSLGGVLSGAIVGLLGGFGLKKIKDLLSKTKTNTPIVPPLGKGASSVKDVPPSAIGKGGKFLKVASKALIPVSAGLSYYQKGKELEGREDLSITEKRTQQTSNAAGTIAGGLAGAKALGMAGGAMGGPVGAIIGGVVGGIGGSILGSGLGDAIGERLSPIVDGIVSKFKADQEPEKLKLADKTKELATELKTATMGVINNISDAKAKAIESFNVNSKYAKEKIEDVKPSVVINDFSNHLENLMQRSTEQMRVTTDEFVGMTKAQTDAVTRAINDAFTKDTSSDKIVDSIEKMTDKLGKVFGDAMRNNQQPTAQQQFASAPAGNDMMSVMGR